MNRLSAHLLWGFPIISSGVCSRPYPRDFDRRYLASWASLDDEIDSAFLVCWASQCLLI